MNRNLHERQMTLNLCLLFGGAGRRQSLLEAGAQLGFPGEQPSKLKSGYNLISTLLLGKSKHMLPFAQS